MASDRLKMDLSFCVETMELSPSCFNAVLEHHLDGVMRNRDLLMKLLERGENVCCNCNLDE